MKPSAMIIAGYFVVAGAFFLAGRFSAPEKRGLDRLKLESVNVGVVSSGSNAPAVKGKAQKGRFKLDNVKV
ncbi:MAG: hypothetical protein GXP54_03525, partial [Deltaproteobacteria bacterium]|nr:hypothetical protein [Deltaproteobacteria bacterium]